jgi:hypothetical protein
LNIHEKHTQIQYIREKNFSTENEIRQYYKILNKMLSVYLSKEEIDVILNKEKITFIDLDFIMNDESMLNIIYYLENLKDLIEFIVRW